MWGKCWVFFVDENWDLMPWKKLPCCLRSVCLHYPFARCVPHSFLVWQCWQYFQYSWSFLASGLLYVSELIEEHSRLAKQTGQRGIYVCHIHTPLMHCLTMIQSDRDFFSRCIILHRLASISPDYLLYHLPHCLPPEFLAYLATHITLIASLHCFLHTGYCGPLHMVLPLLAFYTSGEISQESSGQRVDGTRIHWNCVLLRYLCVAGTSVSFSQSECKWQHTTNVVRCVCISYNHQVLLNLVSCRITFRVFVLCFLVIYPYLSIPFYFLLPPTL